MWVPRWGLEWSGPPLWVPKWGAYWVVELGHCLGQYLGLCLARSLGCHCCLHSRPNLSVPLWMV
jgi:hypothetical protein